MYLCSLARLVAIRHGVRCGLYLCQMEEDKCIAFLTELPKCEACLLNQQELLLQYNGADTTAVDRAANPNSCL